MYLNIFSTVVDGYVLYAAMEVFGMASPHAAQTVIMVHANDSQGVKKKAGDLVDKYALFKAEFDESTTLPEEICNTEAPKEGYFADFPSVTRSMRMKREMTTRKFSACTKQSKRKQKENTPKPQKWVWSIYLVL